MKSDNWNPNFAVAKEYKIDWSTTANTTSATAPSANMTDADPFRNAAKIKMKRGWPTNDPRAEIPWGVSTGIRKPERRRIIRETTARWELNPWRLLKLWKLNGSLSAVSKPNFASTQKSKYSFEYSFENSWRDLSDLHSFAPLRRQQFSKFSSRILAIFHKISNNIVKILQFSRRFALQLHWQSITKKMWGRKEKKENMESTPNFVGISQNVQKMLPHTENLRKILGFVYFAY